ncbi:MAG: phosphoglycerate dehydrogenase, partial [Planctomycetia bacterium]|nr:phosphoglycerate dehydrogenase [Planctomycetia bacterium]
MKKVLVADNLARAGLQMLKARKDIRVEVRTGLSRSELKEIIGGFDGIIVRSATKLTRDVIARAKSLKVIARAGVGVDNVDVEAATKRGILVLNTPDGNTVSAAELAIGMMLALARNIPLLDKSVKDGKWLRGETVGTELFGKVLGLVGLGRIGSEVARRAHAFGMKVIAHDPYVSPEQAAHLEVETVSLTRLLKASDFISIHSPLNPETRGMIGKRQFALMKKGVRIVNGARGGIIDEGSLLAAIKSGTVAGCALDVFEQEPPVDRTLICLPQVVCSPHIGASTEEAQETVARQAVEQMLDALDGKHVRNAVNAPEVAPEDAERMAPFLELARKMGMLLVQYTGHCPERVKLTMYGQLSECEPLPLSSSFTAGIFSSVLSEPVNYVNAPLIARERGLHLETAQSDEKTEFSELLVAETGRGAKALRLAGTVFGSAPRIVQINNYPVNIEPTGHLLICRNRDKPGVIKHLSSVVADASLNISDMTVGRDRPGGTALTVIRTDAPVSEAHLSAIGKAPLILDAKGIS